MLALSFMYDLCVGDEGFRGRALVIQIPLSRQSYIYLPGALPHTAWVTALPHTDVKVSIPHSPSLSLSPSLPLYFCASAIGHATCSKMVPLRAVNVSRHKWRVDKSTRMLALSLMHDLRAGKGRDSGLRSAREGEKVEGGEERNLPTAA